VLRPDLLTEWHPTRNQGIDPFAISRGSERKVWWRCATCQTEWADRRQRPHPPHATPRHTTPQRLPTCVLAQRAEGLTVVASERSFATRYLQLREEWQPTRNGGLDPLHGCAELRAHLRPIMTVAVGDVGHAGFARRG
jgi:Probable Zinc-ribbon domain